MCLVLGNGPVLGGVPLSLADTIPLADSAGISLAVAAGISLAVIAGISLAAGIVPALLDTTLLVGSILLGVVPVE